MNVKTGAADRLRRRRSERCPDAASRSRPPASCRASSAPARKSAACWRSRCMRCATNCATYWCRSTGSTRLNGTARRLPRLSGCRPTRERITFEYVMLKGVNDSASSRRTRSWCSCWKGIPAKINLIPFNPWPGSDHECSDWELIERFCRRRQHNGRIRLTDPHPARPRYFRRLRSAEIGIPAYEKARPRCG